MRRLKEKVSHGWDRIRHKETNADRGSRSTSRTRHNPDQPTEQQPKGSATLSVLCRDSTRKEKHHCEDLKPQDVSQGNSAKSLKHSLVHVAKDDDAEEESDPHEPSKKNHRNEGQARDLWNEAFEKLSPATQAQLRAFGYEPVSVTSQQEQRLATIVKVLQQKQKQCEEETWKFDVGQHKIIVRDYASKCATWVQLIGDLVVPFAPSQAAGPWGLIKKVLEVPVAFDTQMTALLGTVDRVLQVTHRARVYEVIYSAEDGGIEETLRHDLVNLYQATLALLSCSADLLSKSTAERVLKGMFDGTTGLFSDLAAKERELKNTASACESKRSAESDGKMLQHMQALQGYLPRIESRVTAFLEKLEEKEALDILDWISPVKYGENHNLVRGNRTQGTGEWLLQHRIFRHWEESSSTAVLWLRGSPGTGKTFLTSRVIDHVEGTLRTTANDEGFAYFYCNRTEDIRTRPLAVAQSYVRQLSSSANKMNSCYIQSKLRTCCKEQRIRAASLDLALCRTLLIESLNLYPRTTLILDAFDECDPASRKELHRLFEELLSVSTKPIKLFIASRPDRDIRSRFQSRPNIEIQSTDNRDDIEAYIRQRIPDVIEHEELHAKVISTLLEKCDGMFQWTALQLDQLAKCISSENILESLGRLPRTLDEAYDRLYQQICDNGFHDGTLAERAFKWVLASSIPLSRAQLLEAVRVNPDRDEFEQSSPVTADELLSLCRNLLVLDSKQDVWRVSHLSVAEYFETRHSWSTVAVSLMASKVCLLSMLSDYNWKSVIDKDESRAGSIRQLMDHCVRCWQEYVHTLEGSDLSAEDLLPVTRLLERFLGAPEASSAHYRHWAAQIKGLQESVEYSVLAVCRHGIFRVLEQWWEDAELVLIWGDNFGHNPVALATSIGHGMIVRTLVQKGCSVNTGRKSEDLATALMVAAYERHIEIARFLLLEGGANASIQVATDWGRDQSTCALDAAIRKRDLSMLKLLVFEGRANVNMHRRGCSEGSVLALAAAEGWLEGIRLLVEEGGADVDLVLEDGDFISALATATWNSKDNEEAWEVMKYFVETRKASVNLSVQDDRVRSPMAAAVDAGDLRAVQYLVEVGMADVNMPLSNRPDGSALARAADLVKTAEQKGGFWCGATQLQLIRVVQFLLAAGARVILDLGHGSTADAWQAFDDHPRFPGVREPGYYGHSGIWRSFYCFCELAKVSEELVKEGKRFLPPEELSEESTQDIERGMDEIKFLLQEGRFQAKVC